MLFWTSFHGPHKNQPVIQGRCYSITCPLHISRIPFARTPICTLRPQRICKWPRRTHRQTSFHVPDGKNTRIMINVCHPADCKLIFWWYKKSLKSCILSFRRVFSHHEPSIQSFSGRLLCRSRRCPCLYLPGLHGRPSQRKCSVRHN